MEANGARKQPPNPSENANVFSIVLFWWLNKFIGIGNSKTLLIDDLYECRSTDKSCELGFTLQKAWDKELIYQHQKQQKGKPNLLRALIKTFGVKYVPVALLGFFEVLFLRVGQPLCLSQLVLYFSNEAVLIGDWQAYLYSSAIVLSSILSIVVYQHQYFLSQVIAMQIRVATSSLIYKKCLKLSPKALGKTSTGQVVNLLANDIAIFETCSLYFSILWTGPLLVLASIVIMCFYFGIYAFVIIAILVLLMPIQLALGKKFSKLRLQVAKYADERIQTTNAMVSGMHLIKMYTWEKPFAKLVDLCRRREIDVLRRSAYYRALNMSLTFISSKFCIFLTFVLYMTFTDNVLTTSALFLVVSLFDNIHLIIFEYFPEAILRTSEAIASTKRIEYFLLMEEIGKAAATKESTSQKDCLISLKGVSVKWPESEQNTLNNISFNAEAGKLLAVIGHVGSGKSSLLSVILGELEPLKGSCKVIGRTAYASQEPWIFSGTVRQNIICGLEYDADRYNRVIEACALVHDIRLFPNGDSTVVGELGITLSGGQKARVNLARALYIDADIYLLDDPLSAVDVHVGQHLFDKAINTFLDGKIRVLVTHQLHYLKEVDRILILNQGQLECMGTLKQLSRTDSTLRMLKNGNGMANQSIEPENISTFPSLNKKEKIMNEPSVNYGSIELQQQDEKSDEMHSVTCATYWKYLRAGSGYSVLFTFLLICIVFQFLYSFFIYWLSHWTYAEQQRKQSLINNVNIARNISTIQSPYLSLVDFLNQMDTKTGIYGITGITLCLFTFSMLRAIIFFSIALKASIKLHDRMFQSVTRAPLLFFQSNPIGHILNRFSRDIGCIDGELPVTFMDLITMISGTFGSIVIIGLENYWLLIPIALIGILIYILGKYYIVTARTVKQLESTTRSPVFSHVSASLDGLTTIRAHQSQNICLDVFQEYLDVNTSARYLVLALSYWFISWLDLIGAFYVACVTFTCVSLRNGLSSSEAGLIISSAIASMSAFSWCVKQATELHNAMLSTERVVEYSKITSEAPLESSPDKKPLVTWPAEGTIKFDEMSLRYSINGATILNKISFEIRDKEKIGIVGRTGAGKSSLITSLFRLAETEGQIIIDGVDIKTIVLHDLRSKISIIPQDPVLFSGSLRKNLDPSGDYNDQQMWNALEAAKLKECISKLTNGLDSVMTEGGSNLSVGQRQLVCLARAILRRNRILVMDEATANVDQATDRLIQTAIREQFRDCTVLTIAHRLNTILDADRVMVLDAGYLMEFDEPSILLDNPDSMFYSLVSKTRHDTAE